MFNSIMSLTEEETHTIRHYQYCGGDTSPIYKHFLSPWAQYCVDKFVPITVAPNTITLFGLVSSVLATVLTIVVNPTLEQGAPWWLHASTGLAIFLYQTLDNMDGKQARRTGSSSALGMFFDHACDSINAGVTIIAMGSVMGTGWTPLLFIPYIASFIPFYLQTWEEYYSHQMVLPPFNGPTEGLLMSIGLCILSATFGSEFFHKPLLDSPAILIQPDESFLCSVGFPCASIPVIRFISVIAMTLFVLLAYTSVTLLSSAMQVVSTAKLSNGLLKYSFSGALFTLLPFLVYLPCVYFYSFYCKLGFQTNPILLAIMHCSVFAEMVMHIMVAHLVGGKIRVFERYGVWIFVVIAFLGVFGEDEFRSLEYALLIFNSGFSAIMMINNFILVCTEFSSALKIHVFDIVPKNA